MDRKIRLMTIEEVAVRLKLGEAAVWGYVDEGKLTASKIEGRYLVSEMQLEFFVQSQARGVGRRPSLVPG